MKLSNLETTRYPIIYMSIGFLWSSIMFAYGKRSLGLVLFVTSLFLLFVAFRESKEFALIIVIVLIIGWGINNSFYKFNIGTGQKFRIVKTYGSMSIGEYRGKKIRIMGNLNGAIEGDVVWCKGEFIKSVNYENGEVGILTVKESKVVENSVFTRLTEFKEGVKAKLRKNIGMRKEALVSSILFGKNNYLDVEDREEMTNLGIIHAMSVSGLHIALIFAILKKIVGIKGAIILSFGYVLITGVGFSSMRAWIMMLMLSMSNRVKKTNNSIGGLALSSIIIFFWKPYAIFDVGFQLSYGATLGIILFNKKINDRLYKLNSILRSGISISLSAQIFVFPLLVIYFNSFSTSFLLGNLLLIPIINLILLVGVLSVVSFYITPIFDFFSYILLKLVEILDFGVRSVSYLELDSIYLGETVGYFYVFILVSLYLYWRGIRIAKYLPIPYMIVLFIKVYSPIPTIEYRREGAILINFKGEKAIMASSESVDREELVNKTGGSIVEGEGLKIRDMAEINRRGKDFILEMDGNRYYLNMSRGKKEGDYDIINFKDGKEKRLLLLDKEVVVIE